jgi:AcrR family transcriptional regulator
MQSTSQMAIKPGGSLRTRKKDQTRRALLDTADRLFHQKGYEATTLDEICEQSDISLRTFFRYFESKRDLALYDNMRNMGRLRDLLARVRSPAEGMEELESLYDFFAMEFEQDKKAQSRLFLMMREPALASRALMLDLGSEARMATAFSGGGKGDAAANARLLAILIVGGIRHAVSEWVASDGKTSLRDSIKAVFRAARRANLLDAPRIRKES